MSRALLGDPLADDDLVFSLVSFVSSLPNLAYDVCGWLFIKCARVCVCPFVFLHLESSLLCHQVAPFVFVRD